MEYEDDIDALYATYQSLLPMAEADRARLWQKFRLDWNYNSNRIEGNTLTRGETKELLEEGIKPIRMRKDIQQMESHDKAIDFLRELAASVTPLSEMDIRGLHKTALGENYWTEAITAENVITKREIEIGVYKKVPNIVLKSDGSTHEYASPQEVPARMDATVKRLRGYLKKPDIPLHDYLAELHQDFIQTHPFDDGNGRVVRLLINYVCLHLKWPPIIIKSEKRSEYIASLESWNDGNEKPFPDLMKRELMWSLKKSIAAARGEDIEDDGDLDKEIDLFVRESEQVLIPSEKSLENIQSLYKNSILPIIRIIERRANKLKPIFTEVEIEEQAKYFELWLDRESDLRSLSKNNYNFYYYFHELRTTSNKIDISLNVSLVLKERSYTVSSHIETKFKISGALPSALQFEPMYEEELSNSSQAKPFGENFTEIEIKMFSDKTTRQLKSLIAFYQIECGRELRID